MRLQIKENFIPILNFHDVKNPSTWRLDCRSLPTEKSRLFVVDSMVSSLACVIFIHQRTSIKWMQSNTSEDCTYHNISSAHVCQLSALVSGWRVFRPFLLDLISWRCSSGRKETRVRQVWNMTIVSCRELRLCDVLRTTWVDDLWGKEETQQLERKGWNSILSIVGMLKYFVYRTRTGNNIVKESLRFSSNNNSACC